MTALLAAVLLSSITVGEREASLLYPFSC